MAELERSEAAQRRASDELRHRVEERAADLRSVDESLQREAAERRRSEERFRNIFEFSNDAILVLDTDHDEILDANPRACRLLSYTRQELGNLSLGALFPEHLARLQSFALAVVAEGYGWIDEITCQTRTGDRRDVELSASEIPHGPQRSCILALMRDITDRKHTEARILASLQEKEVLLQEIHHRVKNNLQIVSSLLELQSSHLHDPAAVAMLSDSRNRVRSMALVHERLYQTENLADIALREYVPELCTDLRNSYLADAKGVALQVNVADISFDVDHAIPCGLIINELVSNAFKYAFPNSREGTVTVELAPTGLGGFELTVRDDGAGMPAELDFESPSTLGLQLVSALVGQLKGVIQVDRSAGTTIAITFGNPPDADG